MRYMLNLICILKRLQVLIPCISAVLSICDKNPAYKKHVMSPQIKYIADEVLELGKERHSEII